MRTTQLSTIALFALSLALFACGPEGKKDEGAHASAEPKSTVEPKTVFDNDYASVVKVVLAPGEELTAHEGGKRLIYSLTDYSIEWTEKGEGQGIKTWKAEDVHAHEAGMHTAINSGSSSAEWLAFVRKKAELPECGDNSTENDVNAVSADFAKMIFENDDYRITKVTLPPAQKIPMHSGINRIIYSLSDYTIRYESDNEPTSEQSFKQGDIHWHEACTHAIENTGETDAVYLVVLYK